MEDKTLIRTCMVNVRLNASELAEAKAFCGKDPVATRMREEFLAAVRGKRKGRHPSIAELRSLELRIGALLARSGFPDLVRKLMTAEREGRFQFDEIEHVMLLNACADVHDIRERMVRARTNSDEDE